MRKRPKTTMSRTVIVCRSLQMTTNILKSSKSLMYSFPLRTNCDNAGNLCCSSTSAISCVGFKRLLMKPSTRGVSVAVSITSSVVRCVTVSKSLLQSNPWRWLETLTSLGLFSADRSRLGIFLIWSRLATILIVSYFYRVKLRAGTDFLAISFNALTGKATHLIVIDSASSNYSEGVLLETVSGFAATVITKPMIAGTGVLNLAGWTLLGTAAAFTIRSGSLAFMLM